MDHISDIGKIGLSLMCFLVLVTVTIVTVKITNDAAYSAIERQIINQSQTEAGEIRSIYHYGQPVPVASICIALEQSGMTLDTESRMYVKGIRVNTIAELQRYMAEKAIVTDFEITDLNKVRVNIQ